MTNKNGKGKQPKASGSKLDGVVIVTRKSSRLNDASSKKARISGSEELFRRLASEFAAIGRTCEEIADSMDA
jgi:hypothetical protein